MQFPAVLGYTAFAAFIVWRVYVRFRRAFGPQRLSRFRAPVTFAIYGAILLALMPLLWGQSASCIALALGMVVGAALGAVALSKTVFLAEPGCLRYLPYTPIAAGLALFFVARIAWRLAQVLLAADGGSVSHVEFIRNPLTLCAFGLWVGYILWYTYGLAAWRRRVIARKVQR